jgi:succinate dehydrogenase/fumarate reductase-like Fe-S protein
MSETANQAANQTARLLIQRGTSPADAREDAFDVPFEAGQSVLDGLRWLRANRDPTLAFRFSCISANACKECMMRIDGKVVYACLARLEPREMRLAPLPNKPLVRDLVSEIAPPAERLTPSPGRQAR